MSPKEIVVELFNSGEIEVKTLDEALKQAIFILDVAKRNNLDLSEEQFRFIMTDHACIFVNAGAGTGKTTVTQLRNLRKRVFCGYEWDEIVNIAFNDDAIEAIKSKYAKFAQSVGQDPRCCARTFHSLAIEWVKEYKFELGVQRPDVLMSFTQQVDFMKVAVGKVSMMQPDENLIKSLIKFYNYSKEAMLTEDEIDTDTEFVDLGMHKSEVVKAMSLYEKLKQLKKMIDYTDQIYYFKKLFDENPRTSPNSLSFLERLTSWYKIVAFDEWQDASNLMDYIFFRMTVKQRVAIGDINQGIYDFRGANPYKDFVGKYNGKILPLMLNRRCKSSIVDAANKILQLNTLTPQLYFPRALNEGGSINFLSYSNERDEMDNILEVLKKVKDPTDCTISFRNRERSSYITFRLLQEGIPFRLGNVRQPFSDILSLSLNNLIYMLVSPTSTYYAKHSLFKVLPIKKGDVYKIIKPIEESRQSVLFWELDFSEFAHLYGFQESMNILKYLSENLRRLSMAEVMKNLLPKFKKYYWNKMRLEFPEILEEEIFKIFLKDRTCVELQEELDMIARKVRNNEENAKGPFITTFHGLKGLEFNDVIATGLNEETIPNRLSLMRYGLGYQKKLESCNRLFYVLLTRAKTNVYLSCDKTNPTWYRSVLNGEVTLSKDLQNLNNLNQKHEALNVYKNESSKNEEFALTGFSEISLDLSGDNCMRFEGASIDEIPDLSESMAVVTTNLDNCSISGGTGMKVDKIKEMVAKKSSEFEEDSSVVSADINSSNIMDVLKAFEL